MRATIKEFYADIERIYGKAATANMFIPAVCKYSLASKLTTRMHNEQEEKIVVNRAKKMDRTAINARNACSSKAVSD